MLAVSLLTGLFSIKSGQRVMVDGERRLSLAAVGLHLFLHLHLVTGRFSARCRLILSFPLMAENAVTRRRGKRWVDE